MGKVIFDISMSLDGYITGANPRPEAGLGDDGERLHEWFWNDPSPTNQKFKEWFETVGANIFGRATYDVALGNWGADGPSGAARIPTVIVSHSVPDNAPEGHVYHFANGIDAALEQARALAGDKPIYITGGDVAQQFLKRGLIDEISIHVIPAIFGSGVRLFEGYDGDHITLEIIETIDTPSVTHLRYRVV